MDLIDDIEKGFDLVDEVSFEISPFKDNNHWVTLTVHNIDKVDRVLKAYADLQEIFKDGERYMVIHEGQYYATIALINDKTGEVINIRQKRFDFDKHARFLKVLTKKEPIDLRIETYDPAKSIKGHFLFFFVRSTKKLP